MRLYSLESIGTNKLLMQNRTRLTTFFYKARESFPPRTSVGCSVDPREYEGWMELELSSFTRINSIPDDFFLISS